MLVIRQSAEGFDRRRKAGAGCRHPRGVGPPGPDTRPVRACFGYAPRCPKEKGWRACRVRSGPPNRIVRHPDLGRNRPGVSYRHCRVLQRADGHDDSFNL